MSIPCGPILVVEDTPNVLELLDVTLRFKGYPVVTARNGQEALEKIAIERPAMVITDILMPKMDGYSLAHTTEEFLLTVAEILTMGVPTMPRPMDDQSFYAGYRERLEAKLRHKNTQITRTERLLQTLQADQQPAFQALLNSAIKDRDEIEEELASLLKLLSQIENK